MGLAGSALCLEFHFSEHLPAWWRLPRTPFVSILVAEGVFGFVAPAIAGAAHLGGFLAGYVATRYLAEPAFEGRPVDGRVKAVAGALCVATLISFASAGALFGRNANALDEHAQNLLATLVRQAHLMGF